MDSQKRPQRDNKNISKQAEGDGVTSPKERRCLGVPRPSAPSELGALGAGIQSVKKPIPQAQLARKRGKDCGWLESKSMRLARFRNPRMMNDSHVNTDKQWFAMVSQVVRCMEFVHPHYMRLVDQLIFRLQAGVLSLKGFGPHMPPGCGENPSNCQSLGR